MSLTFTHAAVPPPRLIRGDAASASWRPLVFDSPHSGEWLPPGFRSPLPRSLFEHLQDTWVDQLYDDVPALGASLLCAPVSRMYLDLNRGAEDIDPLTLEEPWPGLAAPSARAALGMGLVWREVQGQAALAQPLSLTDMRERLSLIWHPYRRLLHDELDRVHDRFGEVLHVNVHCMSDEVFQWLGLPDQPLADVVLGNLDGASCDARTLAVWRQAFEAQGFSVAENWPFRGADLIQSTASPGQGRQSLQIEIKRSLYRDALGWRVDGPWQALRRAIASAVRHWPAQPVTTAG